jgi:hypothetical protein
MLTCQNDYSKCLHMHKFIGNGIDWAEYKEGHNYMGVCPENIINLPIP